MVLSQRSSKEQKSNYEIGIIKRQSNVVNTPPKFRISFRSASMVKMLNELRTSNRLVQENNAVERQEKVWMNSLSNYERDQISVKNIIL